MEKSSQPTNTDLSFHLLWSVLLLTAIGLLVIYTSSSVPAYQKFGDAFYFVKKQSIVAIFGIFIIYVILKVPFRFIENMTLPTLVLSLLLMIFTLVPGLQYSANGAARWIQFNGLTFQPVEFAKLALILFLSKNLSRANSDINRFYSGILPNLFVFTMFAVLLMLQPDFGSTFLLFMLTFLMLFVAGLPRRYILGGFLAAALGVSLAIWRAPYRLNRLLSFLDPWEDIQRGGFQIIQSYLGFQNGGLFGLGLGESRQKLYFLPEAHTDFILSVIGEELGFVGVLLIVATFLYLFWIGIKVTSHQVNPHRKFLAFGITILVSLQALLNMAVCMGLLPTKGIPLPFVSSGSSSLVIFLIASGILIRLERERFHEVRKSL